MVRYHYSAAWANRIFQGNRAGNSKRWKDHVQSRALLEGLQNMLVRYGFQGYGEPANENGIIVFAVDRVSIVEAVTTVPWTVWRANWHPRDGSFSWPLDGLAEFQAALWREGTEEEKAS